METLQEFQPRLVYNNYKEHIKVSHELELLLKTVIHLNYLLPLLLILVLLHLKNVLII